jgi:hypothetical protein
MTDAKLPDDLRVFIHECIPHVDAAELLLLLARDAARAFAPTELKYELKHSGISVATLERYLLRFSELGLVARENNTYRLAPDASEYGRVLAELGRLYNEQPVTLVRMIYAPKDERIRAFADAFKLKKT